MTATRTRNAPTTSFKNSTVDPSKRHEPGLIGHVAERLLGEPNPAHSKPTEARYGNNGSLSLDLLNNTFFDHETSEGGGLLDFIVYRGEAKDQREAGAWLDRSGLTSAPTSAPPPSTPAKTTTGPKATRPNLGSPVAAYDYRDAAGDLVMQVLRFEPKTFRQRRPVAGGWENSVKDVHPVPYRLPELLAAPLSELVYIVEGEKDADRLASLGLVATCCAGGAGKWRAAYAEHLKGRVAILIPDNDDAGRDHVSKVAASLKGIAARVTVVELPGLSEKGDVSDWLDAGGTPEALAELVAVAALAPPTQTEGSEEEDDEGRKDSLSSQLVAFVASRTELFHNDSGDAFAMILDNQTTHRLLSAKFKSWLMAMFYESSGKAARDQSVREALQVLDGLAQHKGEKKAVHIRVAKLGDAVFVDLAQPGNSLAAKIEAGRWQLVQEHAVRFLRPDTMRPLPTPTAASGMGALWQFVNVPEGARLLVLAWLLECLRPDGVFPVLEILGEAGSAKSTLQRILRMLVDPNASNLRSPPKSVEDVFISASLNWVASFENVSHLAAPMQDALCVLATGGGYAKRKLYSDGDESVINVVRPVVLNGISACITAHDLIDRSICIEPQRIQTRREDGDIEREFEAAYPGLVASLFQLMAQTLKELPDTQLPAGENIRLAGFARLGVAMERAMGEPQGEFLRQFHASRQESIARTIDSSPVATALVEWFEVRGSRSAEMSVKALLLEVEGFKPQGSEAWPKTAKGFGDALRRAAPSLRYMGIEVRSLGKVGGTVKWAVRTCSTRENFPTPSPECPDVLLGTPKTPESAQNSNKTGGQAGHDQDIRTFRTLSPEVFSRTSEAGGDVVGVDF
jgi:hypothetical protein